MRLTQFVFKYILKRFNENKKLKTLRIPLDFRTFVWTLKHIYMLQRRKTKIRNIDLHGDAFETEQK